MLILRSALFSLLFYVFFVGLMIVGLPSFLLPLGARMVVVRFWARGTVWLLDVICRMKIEFRNVHHLPKGAGIVAVKHQSFLETIALITVLGDFSYVFKKQLMAIPFFGWYLLRSGQVGVDRQKRAGALPRLQKAVDEKLAAGCQVVIFPEGTRRAVGLPPAYKPGVAALCAKSNVPCTPVALNTGLFWPRHSLLRRPGTVVVEFLPPIPPGLGRREFMRALQNAIEPATNALVARAIAEDPSLDQFVAKPDAAPILTKA